MREEGGQVGGWVRCAACTLHGYCLFTRRCLEARGEVFELKNKQTNKTISHFIDEPCASFRIVTFSLKPTDFHGSKKMPREQGGDLHKGDLHSRDCTRTKGPV